MPELQRGRDEGGEVFRALKLETPDYIKIEWALAKMNQYRQVLDQIESYKRYTTGAVWTTANTSYTPTTINPYSPAASQNIYYPSTTTLKNQYWNQQLSSNQWKQQQQAQSGLWGQIKSVLTTGTTKK